MKSLSGLMRIGILLLALCCCLIVPIGCGGKDTPDVGTATGEGTDTVPVTGDDGRTKLVHNGKAVYTLVYPDKCSSTVTAAMERLVTAIAEATGVTLETKSDALKRGAVYDASTPELLFGRTDYDQTAEVLKGLEDDQFVIRKVGNKIVFASPKDANLDAAVTHFCEYLLNTNLTEETSGMKTLYLEEFTSVHQEDDGTVRIDGVPLSDFTIVYETERTGYMEVAVRLRDIITEKHGVTLPLYADNNKTYTETTAEILIGKTNRAISSEIWAEKSPKLMTYEAVVRGGKLQVVCGGPFSARECVDYLRFGLDTSLAAGSHYATNIAPSYSERASEVDVRLMTTNVLAAWWGEQTDDAIPPVAQRIEILAAVLVNYAPDAVGLQETDPKWLKLLPDCLALLKSEYGLEYTWMFSKVDGYTNLTSILYRSDKYTLKESDAKCHSYWPIASKKYHLRILTWVYLEEKTAPDHKFILVNTHWAWESDEWIAGSVNEQIEMVNTLKSTYGVPVFCTGDFNSKTGSAEYNKFVSGTGVADLCTQAESANVLVNKCGGCGTVGVQRSGGNYIDHIFGTGNYTVLKYETVVGNRIHWLSDHAPHLADIKFN